MIKKEISRYLLVVVVLLLSHCATPPVSAGEPVYFDCPTDYSHPCTPIHPPDAGTRQWEPYPRR